MNIIYSILVVSVWFLSTYFIIVLILTLLSKRSSIYEHPLQQEELPKVSIVVSAYNEEKNIATCIKSFENTDYPREKLQLIIVNDGSTDKTVETIRKIIDGTEIILIDNKINKGKAACLNEGIKKATGMFVACMDADSEITPNTIRKTIPYFKDRKIAAVTVTVEVKDPKNLIEQIIDIEYLIGLSMSLKALSFFDTIHVTPGPFSIYRKSVLDEIGGFDPKNITEDLEIAFRIQKCKYRIENCASAKVRTVTPNTLKKLYAQRKRWYSGALITMLQHNDIIFNRNLGFFGYAIPYMFLLIFAGLALFVYGLVLVIQNLFKFFSYYSLTNFNFLSHLKPSFDLLSFSSLTLFGTTSFLFALISAVICIKLSKVGVRKRIFGIIGFFFLFLLYQIFWAASIYYVLFRRKVRWA